MLDDTYALLTKRDVKMVGYWQKRMIQVLLFFFFFFFFSFYGPRRSLVNKGFIIWSKDYSKEFRFCGNKADNPERKITAEF